MKSIHYVLVICGGLATGLPQLTHAMPDKASPWLLGAASIFALVATIAGTLSDKVSKDVAP